jgi:predicted metal-dependent enzyme (double-stranded beta helix superfamily)
MSPVQLQNASLAPAIGERRIGAVGELAAYISQACCEAPDAVKDGIRSALERAASDPSLLGAHQRLQARDCYARHILYADPSGRFTIIAIVWAPGQFSPPHAHHTWCAYAVYDGDLEETVFAWDAATLRAKPLGTAIRKIGYSCYAGAGLDQIHRLGNSGTRPAISIHVYGVECEHIATHVNRLVETEQEEEKDS